MWLPPRSQVTHGGGRRGTEPAHRARASRVHSRGASIPGRPAPGKPRCSLSSASDALVRIHQGAADHLGALGAAVDLIGLRRARASPRTRSSDRPEAAPT